MKPSRIIIVALMAICLSSLAWAQQPPTVKNAVVEDKVEDIADTGADEEVEDNDDNFIPTEKINVESSVSFPVDI